MKHLAQKLKSRRGASLLFALLVFFLCLLTGVAALTAAAANAGRYTHLQGEQQQYFSVASALELLQGELDEASKTDGALTVTATYTETQEWSYKPDTPTPGGETTYTLQKNYSYDLKLDPDPDRNYFQDLLLSNCVPTEWWTNSHKSQPTLPSSKQKKEYTIQLDKSSFGSDPPAWADSLYPVSVTVIYGADPGNYTLEMDLSTKDGDAYPLRVVWFGVAETETKTETKTTGEIPSTTPAPPDPDSKGKQETITTLTCTLRWSADNRVVTFEDRP